MSDTDDQASTLHSIMRYVWGSTREGCQFSLRFFGSCHCNHFLSAIASELALFAFSASARLWTGATRQKGLQGKAGSRSSRAGLEGRVDTLAQRHSKACGLRCGKEPSFSLRCRAKDLRKGKGSRTIPKHNNLPAQAIPTILVDRPTPPRIWVPLSKELVRIGSEIPLLQSK